MTRPSLTAAGGRALIVDICMLAGRGSITSVLICDDRPGAWASVSEMLSPLPDLATINCVSDGFELVDAHSADPADLVLIGFHDLSDNAEIAISLLLGMDPSAIVVVVGSVDDSDLLVDAYRRGASGLLLWDPAG